MLDAVRYMIVWNPIILFGLHLTLLSFGIKPPAHAEMAQGASAANSTLGSNGTAVLLNLTAVGGNKPVSLL